MQLPVISRRILRQLRRLGWIATRRRCSRNTDQLRHHQFQAFITAVAGAECNTVIELKPEHHAALPWNFA